ncbi:MAG: threonine dehydratase [Cellvibrionaceae bacterium]|jgi:threonine dehydratase
MTPNIIPLEDIRAAQNRIADSVVRTPLIRLNVDDAPAEIYLKLENLQPIGSFKLRGAGNAIGLATKKQLAKGVYTASAGNMAQGVAWNARRLGLPCTVIVPDHAPQTKLDAIERLGGEVIKVTFDEWWQIIMTHQYPGQDGFFIHPVSDPAVMAGNGTIGLEIVEDLPDVDAIITPYGGGGLSCGIASAIRAVKPDTKLYAVEVDTAAPLAASLAAGSPQEFDYIPTFIDGMGGKAILPEMWPFASSLLDGSLVMTVKEIAEAVKLLLERNRVLAEGAGAAPVAAAMSGKAGSGKVVCVISGGNLDFSKLTKILNSEIG